MATGWHPRGPSREELQRDSRIATRQARLGCSVFFLPMTAAAVFGVYSLLSNGSSGTAIIIVVLWLALLAYYIWYIK